MNRLSIEKRPGVHWFTKALDTPVVCGVSRILVLDAKGIH